MSSRKKTSHEFIFFNWSETLPGCDGERQQAQHSFQEQLREKEEREANLIRQLRQTDTVAHICHDKTYFLMTKLTFS